MMKKIYIILATFFVSISSLFADIDAENIHEIIGGFNHARFTLDRFEVLGMVNDKYDLKIGISIQDINSSIVNNASSLTPVYIDDGSILIGDEDDTTSTSKQFFNFPSKMFAGFGMTVNNVGFGFGYQLAYSRLTLEDFGLVDGVDVTENSLTDRYIFSHTFSFGMVLLDGAFEINAPFSFTAADNSYYSSYFDETESPKGNKAFSMLPSVQYNTRGDSFKYIKGTFGFGINQATEKLQDVDDDGEPVEDSYTYSDGHAASVYVAVELGLNLLRNPITIAWSPKLSLAVGINSDSYYIDAMDPEAHKSGYLSGEVPVFLCLTSPFRFSTSIGTAINLYGEPEIGAFYTTDGGDAVANDDAFGFMYGMKAGLEFRPIDDLTLGFDVHAIGGSSGISSAILESSDYVYVVDNAIESSGGNFTFGVNASLTWRF